MVYVCMYAVMYVCVLWVLLAVRREGRGAEGKGNDLSPPPRTAVAAHDGERETNARKVK